VQRIIVVLAIAVAGVLAADDASSAEAVGVTSEPAASDNSGGLQEIVVTARKREEDIQKVPIAITAFSEKDLIAHTVTGLTDLGGLTPSLTFARSSYDPFSDYVGIRGQKTNDVIINESPAVGIYLDEVYLGQTLTTGATSMMDVERAEIDKGPQGTLYGHNTTGGAIKISTAMPNYDGVSGTVKLDAGNFGLHEEAGSINLPLIDQRLALRFTVDQTSHDGYGEDTFSDRSLDNLHSSAARFALRFDPVEGTQIVLRGDYSWYTSSGPVAYLGALAPPTTLNPFLVDAALASGVLKFGQVVPVLTGTATPAQFAALLAGEGVIYNRLLPQLNVKTYTQAYDYPERAILNAGGTSLTIDQRLTDDISIKSITAYRRLSRAAYEDVDATIYPGIEGDASTAVTNQITEELQLNGRALADRLKWVAGYYYYDFHGEERLNPSIQLPEINPASPVNDFSYVSDRSHAVFGQVTYSLTDTVSVTGGARWTTETTSLVANDYVGADEACGISADSLVAGTACEANPPSNKFTNTSYTGSVDWQATDAILLYARSSSGFKAGGNNRNEPFAPFSPEKVTDYEVGIKADFFDHTLRVDAAAYHTKYDDIQRTVLVTTNAGTFTGVQNAASAKIDGVELDVTSRPLQALTLRAALAYTRAKYVHYTVDGVDLSNDPFQDQPLLQGSLSASYGVPDPLGALTSTADLSFQSTVHLLPDNESIYTNAYSTQPSYGLLNLRITQNISRYNLDVSLWAKNVTDRIYEVEATDATVSAGFGSGALGDPRTFGVELLKRF
jgi:iron complex outermembrane recepter protein